ncbi:MAG: ATP-dependent zinc metalloprotease FtsH [Candidatus Melainabacteria bacterium]|nr:MAG: ATP-dependent zinc metalloprotease FtsH [Candidatus Melainabacteria bacterium]
MKKIKNTRKLLLSTAGALALVIGGFGIYAHNLPPAPPAPACQIGSSEAASQMICTITGPELLTIAQSDAIRENKRIVSAEMENNQAFRVLDKEVAPGKIEETLETNLGQHFTLRVKFINGESSTVVLTNKEMVGIRNLLGERFVIGEVPPLTWGEWALANWLPLLAGGGFLTFAILATLGKLPGKMGQAMKMGKSKARLLSKEDAGKVTFKDVIGMEDAKNDVGDIIDYLANPKKYVAKDVTKGVLLVGPPGGGKTLLARAIAGEAGVPFFSISGSDFVEMFVGVGASRVRDMFEEAKKNAPCIIFVDEIDAVGRHRGTGMGGGNDEREQTLNQLLVEMDGFDGKDGEREPIILIAASNRPDVLDPALLRPGRFDRQVEVPFQDLKGRDQMLTRLFEKTRAEAKSAKTPVPYVSTDVDSRKWARKTPGASPADLVNLVREARLRATRQNRLIIIDEDFDEAFMKIQFGERKAIIMTASDKRLTAYHEGAHALVGLDTLEQYGELVTRATIVPRRRALGMVNILSQRDQISTCLGKLRAFLATGMAGRAGEFLLAGGNVDQVTSGAQGDIDMVTKQAEQAITQWGFGPYIDERLSFLKYGDGDNAHPFLGYEMGVRHNSMLSTEEVALVRAAVKKLVDEAFQTALRKLREGVKEWHAISEGLLDDETLEREEILARVNPLRKARKLQEIELEPTEPEAGRLGVDFIEAQVALALKKSDPNQTELTF